MPTISLLDLKLKIIKNYLTRISSNVVDAFFENVTLLLHGNSSNGGQNNTFIDSSINTFQITRSGNTTQGTFSPYGNSWSNYFDGAGDYLLTPADTAFQLGTGDFSIDLWYYPTISNTTARGLFGIGNDAAGAIQLMTKWPFGGWPDNTLALNATSVTTLVADRPFNLNSWNHIAISRASGIASVFLNGTRVINGSFTVNVTFNQLVIGRAHTGKDQEYGVGYISNFRLVKGTALYSGTTITVPTAPFTAIANTSLLTCQSNYLKDNSTNNFTISRNGDVSVQRFGPFHPTTAYLSGTNWQSVYFDGNGDYLSLPNSTAFAYGTSDFTVECWIYKTTSSTMSIIDSNTGSPGTFGFAIFSNKIDAYQTWGSAFSFTHTLALNSWQHLAFVRASGVLYLYVNGTQIGSMAATQNFVSSQPLIIGRNAGSGADQFNGYISNLRIVKGSAIYTSNFTVPTDILTAISNTSLLICQSTSLIDNSPNNLTITAFGNASVKSFSPFSSISQSGSIGGSGYFDGSGDFVTVASNAAFEVGTGEFTLELWLYFETVTNILEFVRTSTFDLSSTLMIYYSSGSISVGPYGGGAGGTTTSWTPTAGQWYHIAASRDSSNNQMLFVNGVLLATATSTVNYLQSGFGLFQRAANFAGYCTDVRLVKGTAVYTANFTPPTAPLIAINNTSILLNFTNASIIDNAMVNNLGTFGNAQISTSVKKYGSGSLFFDGNGDYLSAPLNQGLVFGTGDFTVEYWLYPINNITGTVVDLRSSTSGGGAVAYSDYLTAASNFGIYIASNTYVSTSSIPANQWTHIAVCRSGTNLRVFLNGVQDGSTVTNSQSLAGGTLLVGANRPFQTGGYLNGYVDDLRINKGVARYTSNFTPPTEQFPDL